MLDAVTFAPGVGKPRNEDSPDILLRWQLAAQAKSKYERGVDCVSIGEAMGKTSVQEDMVQCCAFIVCKLHSSTGARAGAPALGKVLVSVHRDDASCLLINTPGSCCTSTNALTLKPLTYLNMYNISAGPFLPCSFW